MFPRSPRLRPFALACLIALPSCTRSSEESTQVAPLSPGTPIRFAGEMALEDGLAGAQGGAITLTLRAIGAEAARDPRALRRTYEVRDPYWWTSDRSKRIYFHLDEKDALSTGSPPFKAEMELEARYDPDGNVATEEEGVVRSTARVRTGDRDIRVAIRPPASTADPSPTAVRAGTPKGS